MYPRYLPEAIWLTPQVDLFTEHGSEEFSETWPKSGMTVNGTAYALESLTELSVQAHPTEGSESGSSVTQWNTPTSNISQTISGETLERETKRQLERGQMSLVTQVHHRSMWPTPDCQNHRDGKNLRQITIDAAERGSSRGVSLHHAVTYPTPTARDHKGPSARAYKGRPENLADIAMTGGKMWATPNASDNRDRGNLSTPAIKRRMEKGKQINLSMSVSHESGQLNPAWVCWLMGLPLDYLDLDGYQNPELAGLPHQYLTG